MLRSILRPTALGCALLFSFTSQAKVEVEALQHQSMGHILAAKISEDIAPGDYEALLRGIRAHPGHYSRKIVLLDSIGGSAPEAIRMGRLLRETGFDAVVPSTGLCQGSCIYLLAAGHRKTVNGPVGLHRPHHPSGESALARSLHRHERYSPAAYFREMQVSSRLAEEMQRIEPHRMKVLTTQELAGFGLR